MSGIHARLARARDRHAMEPAVLATPVAVVVVASVVYTGMALLRALDVDAAFVPGTLECVAMTGAPLGVGIGAAVLWRAAVRVARTECEASGADRACQSQVNAVAVAIFVTVASAVQSVLALYPCANFGVSCTLGTAFALFAVGGVAGVLAWAVARGCASPNALASAVVVGVGTVVLGAAPCLAHLFLWRDTMTTSASTGALVLLLYLASTLPTRHVRRKSHTN